MTDLLGLAIAALPGVFAIVCGAIRWRLARRTRRLARRTGRVVGRSLQRTPIAVRVALVSGALLVGACHSIDQDAFAHGPVPLGTLPFSEPIATTDGVAVGEQNGLLGSYFAGAMYERLDHQQIDPNIDYIWDASDTNPVVSGPDGIDHNDGDFRLPDHWPIWSIVWEGYLAVPAPGDYVLRLHVNNGGWLEMKDGSGGLQTIVDCRGGTSFEGDCDALVHFFAADRNYIRISYFNNSPPVADAIFSWLPPGAADFTVVPASALFTQRTGESAEIAPELLWASFGKRRVGLSIGEPVNTFSGNLTISSVDVSVPARGFPLQLERTYNARDTHTGGFGPGWTSNVEWSLVDEGATVRVIRGDGRRDVFARNPDGTYAAPSGLFDALTKRADGSFTLTTPEQTVVEFSAGGAIRRVLDRNGNALAIATDDAGHVTALSDVTGRALVITYDASGRITGATDPAGRNVAYAYDGGRLVAFTDASGATTHYAYDTRGRLATATDPLGNVTMRNDYDSHDRVTAQTDAVGGVMRLSYDNATRTTTQTDSRGNVTRIVHDTQGHPIQVTDATGRSITYTYDARGNKTAFRDRNGNGWSFAYDAAGNRTAVTDPVGAASVFSYDALNDLLTRTDANGNTWRYAYDARGNLVAITNGEGATTAITVDGSGLPTRVVDGDAVATTLAYDAAGNVVTVTTTAGGSSNEYDTAGRLVRRVDANGHASTFAYDALNRVTRATDTLGNATLFAYDAVGNLVRVTDRRGAATTFEYDAAQRLVTVRDALGQTTRFTYDSNGNRTSVTDPSGKTTAFVYDALDRLVRITDPEGGVARLTYDANGNLVTSTDPRGASASYAYNFRNQRVSTRDRSGATTAFTYDAAGRLVSVTDPLGATTQFRYDRADRYLSTTDALGNATRIDYSAGGRRAAVTDAKGNTTRFTYDGAGRLAQIRDAAGGAVSFAYDAVGNLVTRTDQLGRPTRFTYDSLDRLESVVDALGGRSTLGYDPNGQLTSLADANGHSTSYTYDAVGRLTQVTNALAGITRYSYDARGLLTSLTDANGHPRSYAYDGNRRLVTETDALGRARAYRLDPNGNVTGVTDAKGQATALTYDVEDRLLRIAYADGTAVVYRRDAAGQRLSMVDPLGTTTYTYDALRRLTSVTDAFGKTVRYGYDANGNRSALTYPDGRVASYAYDRLDRLTAVGFDGSTIASYAYDAVGNPTTGAFANGSHVMATYDALDRVLALTNTDGDGKVASAFTYSYDAIGNVLTETASGARNLKDDQTYAYDALSRLVAVTDRDKKTTRYGYDAAGNRISVAKNDGADILNGVYDAADQLLALLKQDGSDQEMFGYDANGNLLSRAHEGARTTFSYDTADRLTGFISPDGSTASFGYDGDGNLRTETRSTDEPRSLAYTLDVAGALSQVVAATDGTNSAAYVYGLQRIGAFTSRDARYYGSDVRGSARSQTDERGKVKDIASFDAWGVPHDQGDGSAKLATLFGYTGERQDGKAGLVYLRARWYMPDIARLTSPDPLLAVLADPRTAQRYAYSDSNPATYIDPSGLSSKRLFDQLPSGARFIPVADGCTGQIFLVPDFAGITSEALFGKGQFSSSLADLGLIPTLACNYNTQTKLFANTTSPFICVPRPSFTQPKIQVGLGVTISVLGSAGCQEESDPFGLYFNKATGKTGEDPGDSGGTAPSGGKTSALRDVLDRIDVAIRRVVLRESTKREIEATAERTREGLFVDANTKKPITGEFQYGHKPGFEWWRTQERARAEGWTREQLIEYENIASHYQIEDAISNMSHKFELPKTGR